MYKYVNWVFVLLCKEHKQQQNVRGLSWMLPIYLYAEIFRETFDVHVPILKFVYIALLTSYISDVEKVFVALIFLAL